MSLGKSRDWGGVFHVQYPGWAWLGSIMFYVGGAEMRGRISGGGGMYSTVQ